MIVQILGWGTEAAIAVMTVLLCYGLVITAKNPTAWANRVVAPALPADDFVVHGDDWIGF